jgi:hypothetical protein
MNLNKVALYLEYIAFHLRIAGGSAGLPSTRKADDMSKKHEESPAGTAFGPPPNATRPRLDPELQAMAKLDRIIAELPTRESVERVLAWLNSRYSSRSAADAEPSMGHTPS